MMTPVEIPAGDVLLRGDLTLPEGALGLVIFAHGSGSGRHSPRNRYVAGAIAGRVGTLLVDLLSEEEERIDAYTGHLRFDVRFLTGRLLAATRWAAACPTTRRLRLGYFGSSTGAAAALKAAAAAPDVVAAVVSRGGRPDLAGDDLERVYAPTLLIVGGEDWGVLEVNEAAYARLRGERRIAVVPGAGHLFEEPGALELVAELARDFFDRHLAWEALRHPAP